MASSRIDLHSHLLPAIDDGCRDINDCLACITALKRAGYTATVCTPHLWPDLYPNNIPANIAFWVAELDKQLRARNVNYQLIPGGELRLFDKAIDWMQSVGVPTLGSSRCVLFDFWEDKWPKWSFKIIEWLIAQRYQPIMAHPERISANVKNPSQLDEFIKMGVWLQGNFLSMTGEEGYHADRLAREYLRAGKYQLMALDMHRPETLESRLDGMQLVAAEFGQPLLDHFTITAPRQLLNLPPN